MSNGRYTGSKASKALADRNETVAQVRRDLQDDSEQIVEDLFREVFGDSDYREILNGHQSISREKRAEATEKFQRVLIDRYEKGAEGQEAVRTRTLPKPKRRIRAKRVLAAAIAVIALESAGYHAVKKAFSGAKGTPKKEGIILEESSTTSTSKIDSHSSSSSEVSTSESSQYDQGPFKSDRIAYVVDFMDYYNESQKEHVKQLFSEGMIDGLGIRIGGSSKQYPFMVNSFTDEEINEKLQEYIATGKAGLDHKYAVPVASAEEYIQMSPVTIPYYYTSAVNNEEAEIEATCIEATYNKMKKDMPEYDFKNRMAPIAIDIEKCGGIDQVEDADYLTRLGVMRQRADAVLHLVDSLRERGVVDERGVIIYGDLTSMTKNYDMDWNALFEGLNARNINVVKWGTRAVTKVGNKENPYTDVFNFRDELMNTSTNISYMRSKYVELMDCVRDVAIQQIHLGQYIDTVPELKERFGYGEQYDVNITTEDTLDAIVHGNSIDKNEGFIDKIEKVRMEEVKKDLQESSSQAEEYIPEKQNNDSLNHEDDGDR